MDFKGILIITIFISCSVCEELSPLKFHEDLTPEELTHYFGDLENVPTYEYTDPQPIDRRKRRDTQNADDDKLEYVLNAFGETYHLLLDKNNDLVSPGCVVQRYKRDGSREVAPCSMDHADCYFMGTSSNHSDSWVAASVCGGLHGVVGTEDKTLMVQPIKARHMSRAKRETRLENPHIVYEYKQNKRECDTVKNSREKREEVNSLTDVITAKKSRKRRGRRELRHQYLETAVVADQSAYEFHKEDTEQVLKTIMNVVAQRMMDPTFGAKLFVSVNKIVILEHNQNLNVVEDSAELLSNLCTWQLDWNPSDDSSPEHADYVLLLTKTDLVFKGNRANSGLARMGVCGRNGGCSVNEDSGLGAGLTIAHETGHVLGMHHDHDGNQCANGVNIMSSMAPNGPNAFRWSPCSANVIQTFLNSDKSKCLDDLPPGSAMKSYEIRLKPGTLYTANQQCKLMLGPTAEVCADVAPEGLDVCGGLVCRKNPDSGVNGCVIYGMPRMDGTDCSENNHQERKWCMKGTCVAMGTNDPAPVNGGWSDWDKEYHECSRSCGAGVKVKLRYCNNPEPMYGGKPCEGQNMIGELCNVKPCPTSQFEFMAQQCAATDSRPLKGRTYHWTPNDGAIGDNSCNVNCNAEGTNWISRRGISVDGTQCLQTAPATFSRCVSGKCKAFGCDGRMSSGLDYDHCGICNGKGDTCKKVSGNFTDGKAKEYTTFATIPTGSTGISISEGNVYCSLSVRVAGEELFDAGSPKKSGIYELGGVTIKYQSRPERIEIVGPIKTPAEARVYRKYASPPYVGVDPDVYYEYHTPIAGQTQSYSWKRKPGKCSKSCGTGHETPVITCEGPLGTVETFHCNINDKPAEVQNECNTHACPPRWRDSEWTQCSVTCGGGQRTRSVECVQENREVETVVSDRLCQGQTKPSTSATCNTDKCPGTWKPGVWSACSMTCARGLRTRDLKCYASASSNSPIADSNCLVEDKPEVQEACMVKPCRTDIRGDACVDKKANCFQAYGEEICTNQYKTWAHNNCMKSCGVCAENPGDYNPNCKDVITNCDQYSTGFCTNSAYMAWAKKNCQKFCGYCEDATTTTTTTPAPVNSDCQDVKNCPAYGESVCTKYKNWANINCKRFCKQCDEPKSDGDACIDTADCPAFGTIICSKQEFAQQHCRKFCDLCPDCEDAIATCSRYGDNMCTKYRPWALKNCKSTCNLCGARKKRSVDFLEPPPPMDELEPIQDDDDYVPLTEVEDVPFVVTEDVMNDAAEDIQGSLVVPPLIENDEIQVTLPEAPVCNTVRTASRDRISLFEKLEPGVPCEQTIVLPLGKRVLMKFNTLNVDCAAGDVFLIIDGITNEEIPICNSLLQDEWLSSGSIVSLQFVAGREGHGYAFEYETFDDEINTNVPECSQQVTVSHGVISANKAPHLVGEADETCEVYITATPGDTVELKFNDFSMAGNEGLCQKGKGVLVQDLAGGKEEEFCGKLSPFPWTSTGARVKITYHQSNVLEGFTVEYNMRDPAY